MIASPCIGLCGLDPAAQLCGGCARSGAEIAAWKDADPAERALIWADLPRRRAALGIRLYRLSWSPDQALDFVATTLRAGRGAWEFGPPGASVRFPLGADVAWSVDPAAGTVTGELRGAAFRLAVTRRIRALGRPAPEAPGGERIVLAVPRDKPTPCPDAGLMPLGADRDAIRPADRDARFYDLGLGPESGRLGLRTRDRDLAAELDRQVGRPGADVLRDLAGRSTGALPTLVVANPLARVEVDPAGERPAVGPHAWPDLDLLALGREAPSGHGLPKGFLPCARFDPTPLSGLVRPRQPRQPIGGLSTDGMAP